MFKINIIKEKIIKREGKIKMSSKRMSGFKQAIRQNNGKKIESKEKI